MTDNLYCSSANVRVSSGIDPVTNMSFTYSYKDKDEINFEIERVIFNPPATIVYWKDGSKTIVKCADGETFVEEVGLAYAIVKRAMGTRSDFLRLVDGAYRQPKKE